MRTGCVFLWPGQRRGRTWLVLVALATLVTPHQKPAAQTGYSRGLTVSPAYEGWEPNPDGSLTLWFGYMNSNWEEEFDIPIGPDNNIEPGGPDQGQPTHFYPRRNLFLFAVRVPKDVGNKELVWSLTTHGKTERAYATLNPGYLVDKQTIATEMGANGGLISADFQWNEPPTLKVDGEKRRSVKVGQPLTLEAWANDKDGIPTGMRTAGPGATRGRQQSERRAGSERARAYVPTSVSLPANANGLRLSWMVYRGPARSVTFNPEQMKTWQDTRPYANSPWSPPYTIPPVPPEGKWVVQATFAEPGDYVLRCVTSDGALLKYDDVMVTVTR